MYVYNLNLAQEAASYFCLYITHLPTIIHMRIT